MVNWKRLLAAIVICQLAGVVGSVFTVPAISTWYAALQKPWFNPPNWLFGPVWVLLYTLMGVAMYLVWEKGAKKKAVSESMGYFGAQLFLNAMWSFLFFGLRSPFYGVLCILPLLCLIAMTTQKFYKVSRNAGLLMVPYLAWTSFATLLNISVWLLNP